MSENIRKRGIGIGVEDFKTMIEKGSYLVDKTLMIEEIIRSNATVTLLTRPRRFGKTLNQSMIRRFFEDERKEDGTLIDNSRLFDGLAISECGEEILKHKQQYPVISISLKSAKQDKFDDAYLKLKREIAGEFRRHKYLLDAACLDEEQRQQFHSIMTEKGEYGDYSGAIRFLSECLAKYHGKNVFILIDEYDVPLENAYFKGFYDKMIDFIRSLFESALKTNPYLEKGIITGCLRISKESIFTGLNNLKVCSLLSNAYCDKFGFTPDDVKEMLAYYELSDKYPIVKEWYDGYRFGNAEIYNPWSIINYVDEARLNNFTPRPYWSNTSSNSIVRELVEDADEETRKDLETLMNGGTIEKVVHEDITYEDIHENMDNLWNFLFFTGYLKNEGERQEDTDNYLSMSVPNLEVKSVYNNSISRWFEKRLEVTDRRELIEAFENGDCKAAAEFISEQLEETISYHDSRESFYHGFLAALLSGAKKYKADSNKESGNGRPDLIFKTKRIRNGRAMILELKRAKSYNEMETKCDEALKQIEYRKYEIGLRNEGYNDITKYGICFYEKECVIKKADD